MTSSSSSSMNATAATGLLSAEAAATVSDIIASQELEPFLLNESQTNNLMLSANNQSSIAMPSNLVLNSSLNLPTSNSLNQDSNHTGSSYFSSATTNPCFSADGNET